MLLVAWDRLDSSALKNVSAAIENYRIDKKRPLQIDGKAGSNRFFDIPLFSY